METIKEVTKTVTAGTSSTSQTRRKPIQGLQMRRQEIESDVACAYLRGRLDIAGVQEIEQKLRVLTANQKKSLIVNISEVELISSDGLAMLISIANDLKAHGKRMILVNPNQYVEKVVRLACVEPLLTIESDMDEAIRKVKAK